MQDAEQAGFPPELIAKLAGAEKPKASDVIEIWPENWDTVRAFASIFTQWNVVSVGMGGILYVGLKYEAVIPALTMAGFDVQAIWPGIQTMEIAARIAANE